MHCWLPDPYEDETLYSMLARMQILEGVGSARDLMEMCFGLRTITAVLDLPCHMNRMANRIPDSYGYTPEHLIYNHTLFPYYTAFMEADRKAELLRYMTEDSGGGIHMKSGVMASAIASPDYLKYCPRCSAEDVDKHGELYWRRLHQTPGVLVCPVHNTLLQNSTIPVKGYYRERFVAAEPDNCPLARSVVLNSNNDWYRLSVDIAALYDLATVLDPETLVSNSRRNLQAHGLIAGEKNLRLSRIIAYLNEQLPEHVIQPFFLKSGKSAVIQRLIEILRFRRRVTHPLYYLLLIKGFWGSFEKYQAYSSLPQVCYSCFNGASDHYKMLVIARVKQVRGKHGKRFWHYACDCGFEYSSLELSANPRAIRVIQYGPIWEEKLAALKKANISIRAMSRLMKADSKTIKLHLNRQVVPVIDAFEHNQLIEEKRTNWIAICTESPNAGTSAMRKQNPALYTWLYRHDRKWMAENSPPKSTTRSTDDRVIWNQRDFQIRASLLSVVELLHQSSDKPVRITRSRIMKLSGYQAILEQHLEKLPLCSALLNASSESHNQYLIRKAEWAIKRVTEEKKPLVLWRVLKTMTTRTISDQSVMCQIESLISKEVARSHNES